MGAERKSIATLIDELITTSMRCWHAQDRIMDESLSTELRLKAAETAQLQNARRTALMRAIDAIVDDEQFGAPEKTYTEKK